MESNLVTKKVEVDDDPWVEKEDAKQTPAPGDLVFDRDRLTITLKAGTGYDAPWLVYHAASVDEGIDFLSHERYDELADLTARKGKELAKAFGGSAPAAKPAASSGGWGAKKPAAKPAVSDDAPECEHGERTWVDKGAWRAWMCPAERDDPSKCDPIWANPDGSPQPAKKRR